MGLLQTFGKFSTYVDTQGKYRVIWQFADGRIMMHKFDSIKTAKELDIFFADFEDWNGAIKLMDFSEHEALIIDSVKKIRATPSLTLTQYNTYLSGKPWHEAVIIRSFVYKLALKLAEHYGVILTDYTESQVLLKVRNWIVSAEIRTLKRVIFGYDLTL